MVYLLFCSILQSKFLTNLVGWGSSEGNFVDAITSALPLFKTAVVLAGILLVDVGDPLASLDLIINRFLISANKKRKKEKYKQEAFRERRHLHVCEL